MVTFTDGGKFERVILKQGAKYSLNTSSKEVVVVLLQGQIKVKRSIMSRTNVFKDISQGFAIANKGTVEIKSFDDSQFCLVEADSKAVIPFTRLKPFNCVETGKSNTFRDVCRLADRMIGLQNLIVGETISPSGNWSSWPPHKHDTFEPNKESSQKEVYFYKFSNDKGFGIQMLNDDVHLVKGDDEIVIEKGYHPVVASPHSQMYYFWALYGDNSFFQVRYEGS